MAPEEWDDTTELARLQVLARAVRSLREELVAYRWIVERWLRRGRWALYGLALVAAVMALIGVAFIWRLDTVAERNREGARLEHACLADAVADLAADRPVAVPSECRHLVPDDG